MDRKKITAFLIDCSPDDFMAYADLGASVAVVGPNGKKYRFSNEQLEEGRIKMIAPAVKAATQTQAKKPAARSDAGKGKPKAPVKKTTKRQATTRKKTTKGNGPS
jgi:hypothetical protein